MDSFSLDLLTLGSLDYLARAISPGKWTFCIQRPSYHTARAVLTHFLRGEPFLLDLVLTDSSAPDCFSGGFRVCVPLRVILL